VKPGIGASCCGKVVASGLEALGGSGQEGGATKWSARAFASDTIGGALATGMTGLPAAGGAGGADTEDDGASVVAIGAGEFAMDGVDSACDAAMAAAGCWTSLTPRSS